MTSTQDAYGQPVPEAITTYFSAINAEDWDRLATIWRDDAELHAVGGRPRKGKDEIVKFYPRTLAPWKDHLDDPTRFVVAGDTVTVEIHFTGRSADGVEVEFDAVDVFDLVDGKIATVTNWYDTSAVRKLLPVPVPAAVSTYFDAVNSENWESLRSVWSDDVVVLAVGARPRSGIEDVMGLYTKMFDHWPQHNDIAGRTLVDGNTVTVEVHFVGTTDDGRELEFDAVDVIDIEGGKIKRLTNWYDTSKVRAMIAGR
jgi:ketosteroid isomerase-like protein